MRIDDENKTVWCNEELLRWYESFDDWHERKDKMVYYIARIGWGYALTDYDDNELSDDVINLSDKNNLIKAIIDDYEFKLEQPKKHYWRKKKEHSAWFEDSEQVLIMSKNNSVLRFGNISSYDNRYFRGEFTKQEARELLKGDFDMFEKVEVD